MVLAMAGVTTIYGSSWLIPARIYTWVKAYTMDMASSLVVLLRVLRRSGGKLLFYCLHGCTPKPMFYKHTVLDWEYAQMLRYQPTAIGQVGMSSSHFDARLYGQP
jgi:hypothetical protein